MNYEVHEKFQEQGEELTFFFGRKLEEEHLLKSHTMSSCVRLFRFLSEWPEESFDVTERTCETFEDHFRNRLGSSIDSESGSLRIALFFAKEITRVLAYTPDREEFQEFADITRSFVHCSSDVPQICHLTNLAINELTEQNEILQSYSRKRFLGDVDSKRFLEISFRGVFFSLLLKSIEEKRQCRFATSTHLKLGNLLVESFRGKTEILAGNLRMRHEVRVVVLERILMIS